MPDVKNPVATHSWAEIEAAINKALSELSGLNVEVSIGSASLREKNGAESFLGRSVVADLSLTLQASDPSHDVNLPF
ncbi:hypothetical protein [Cupriavidus nantongensis]